MIVGNVPNSVKDLQALGTAETKLLYTLHWILLFASEECADEEADTFRKHGEKRHQPYLFSIPTISVRHNWFFLWHNIITNA